MNCKLRDAAIAISSAIVAMSASANGDGTDAMLRPSASAAANDVFTYIATRPDSSAHPVNRLVLGQHLGGYTDVNPGTGAFYLDHGVVDPNNSLHTLYPGMVGARYDAPDGTLTEDSIKAINAALITYWKANHSIIAITATPRNPWTPGADRNPSAADGTISELLVGPDDVNPGANKNFWDDARLIANGLEQLKNLGIPVVLRPFAEYNSGKYYGPAGTHANAQTPSDFKALWGKVWDFYATTRRLDNVIFCWEAWVMGRGGSNLASWFPSDDTGGTARKVDIVSGAYYFPAPTSQYFPLPAYALTLADPNDAAVHQNLLSLAESYDKPFGVAQWGLNYDPRNSCSSGGDWHDALGFYNSVLSANGKRRTSFIYHWTGNCAVDSQNDGAQGGPWGFVSNDAAAMSNKVLQVVTYPAGPSGNGWVQSGGATQATGVLRTGDSADKQGYRSVLSFQVNAPAPFQHATLRLRKSGQNNAADPYVLLGKLNVDILDRKVANISAADYAAKALLDKAGALADPIGDPFMSWSEAPMSAASLSQINRAGTTRMRLGFDNGTDNNVYANFLSWYSGDAASLDDRPQLVVTYQP